MKAKELQDLPIEELTRKAGELRENLFNLKIRRRSGTLESTADVTKNRRDLARVLTVLTARQGTSKAQRKTAEQTNKTAAAAPAPAENKSQA